MIGESRYTVPKDPFKEMEFENSKDKIEFDDFHLWYGDNHVLRDIDLDVKEKMITAFMGPSGCGKSSLLRSMNRMNDLIPGARFKGEIEIDDVNINDPRIDIYELRKKVGMVFQKPNPFPMSIYDNVAYGPKLHSMASSNDLDDAVERSLREAALWDEVRDRLNESSMSLSGGQQQRLCIARALAVEPEIILLDEPCSALDPIATSKIEALMRRLKEKYTVILVTHNLQQAARVSDMTAFMYLGEIIEFDRTSNIFENPRKELTENYITGKFG
jgi:phosphate transport system ATP-binding protein